MEAANGWLSEAKRPLYAVAHWSVEYLRICDTSSQNCQPTGNVLDSNAAEMNNRLKLRNIDLRLS